MTHDDPPVTTAEQLWDLADEDHRYDLIRGELFQLPLASPREGRLSPRIGRWLGTYLHAHPTGDVFGAESGFILARDPDTVLGPDLTFVRAENVPAEEDQDGFWEVVPDLVVEVIAPSDTVHYVTLKIDACLSAGVTVVLTVDARRRTVSLHTADGVTRTLRESDRLEVPDVLPNFSLPVSEIFRRARNDRSVSN